MGLLIVKIVGTFTHIVADRIHCGARPGECVYRYIRLLLSAVMAMLALPAPGGVSLAAQAAPTSGKLISTITGTVRDTAGRAVPEAIVYLAELRRSMRTRADGTFSLPDLTPGDYTIGVRVLGFVPVSERIRIDTGTTSVVFELTPALTSLPSVVTKASRGGLSGVILDGDGKPLRATEIRVQGAGVGGAKTDSLGEFFIPVKAGHYLVRVEKPGFERQLVSVTVPPGEGRRMSAALRQLERPPNPIEGANLFDMNHRMIRANPVWARYVTREDLLSFGSQNAQQVAQRYTASPLIDWECAKINGGPATAPLWSIDASEIEFMETTAAPPPRRIPLPYPCRHVVWLRK